MGHADPKVRTTASRVGKRARTLMLDAGETIVTRRLVSSATARRAMRAILRNMPKGTQASESISAKLQAVRQRG